VPTASGHISDIPQPEEPAHPRLRLWARNVGGALLALILFMATWVTAIGWNDQPPTSERLRARRAALQQATRAQSAQSAPNAPASEQTLDAIHNPDLRELSSRTETLRPVRPADVRPAGTRTRAAERQAPPSPANDLDLRLTR
jgi:hypothetical protein